MMNIRCMITHRRALVLVLLGVVLTFAAQASASSPTQHLLANGLDVTLYPAEVLASQLTRINGEPAIPLSGARYLSVITDISDPAISNKGDGSFHPFNEKDVVEALSQVVHPGLRLGITVYVLPYPRRSVLVSSTSGTEIFLSPHVLEIDPGVAAYIVTHELGHVVHNSHLPDGTSGWNDYRRVRGISDESVYFEAAPHANRPKEIFAEDFRALFGGPDAAWDGRIENSSLAVPATVPGLESFMVALGGERVYVREAVVATSYPNPFNPETEIRVTVPDDVLSVSGPVSVRVYDVRGALVRELYNDAPTGAELLLRWDGTDRSGNRVASSQYFADIRAGEHRRTLKLVLLK
jgi:hypothetical protein